MDEIVAFWEVDSRETEERLIYLLELLSGNKVVKEQCISGDSLAFKTVVTINRVYGNVNASWVVIAVNRACPGASLPILKNSLAGSDCLVSCGMRAPDQYVKNVVANRLCKYYSGLPGYSVSDISWEKSINVLDIELESTPEDIDLYFHLPTDNAGKWGY